AHAAVALVNAQLYEEQRREAESAKALLELSQGLSSLTELTDVTDRVAAGSARILGSRHASVWLPSSDTEIQCVACWSEDPDRQPAVFGSIMNVAAARRLATSTRPYMVEPATYESVYPEHMPLGTGFFAVAPLHLEGRSGCICVEADSHDRY